MSSAAAARAEVAEGASGAGCVVVTSSSWGSGRSGRSCGSGAVVVVGADGLVDQVGQLAVGAGRQPVVGGGAHRGDQLRGEDPGVERVGVGLTTGHLGAEELLPGGLVGLAAGGER